MFFNLDSSSVRPATTHAIMNADRRKRELKDMISKLAAVVSNLSLGIDEQEGGENTADSLIQELLSVISTLTKFSREGDVQLEQTLLREQEAMALLEKFKKITKNQKDTIESLTQERKRSVSIVDAECNTEGGDSIDMESRQRLALLQQQLEDESAKFQKVFNID
jgi:hypothetical protein